jgi:GT2 family glycosyltransferase
MRMPPMGTGYSAADIAVAVVSYNTRDLLDRCVRSALAEGPASVVVVDNASSDGSAEHIRTHHPDVTVVANAHNVGYGAAANQALRHATAPLVLLLNADTELQAGCLAALAAFCSAEPRAGIVAPAIVNRTGEREPSVFPLPGSMAWLVENAPLAAVARRVPALRDRSVSLRELTTPQPVPWVMGCALLLRSDCMREVGGFDEDFFMYFEEVDLCHRVAEAGWRVFFTPDATVMHVGGASTSQVRTEMLVHHFRSTMRYYHRHHAGARLAFWVAAMRLKRVALLARDSARLLVEREPATRSRLVQQRDAWRESLRLDGREWRSPGPVR